MKRLADRNPYNLALQFDERHPGYDPLIRLRDDASWRRRVEEAWPRHPAPRRPQPRRPRPAVRRAPPRLRPPDTLARRRLLAPQGRGGLVPLPDALPQGRGRPLRHPHRYRRTPVLPRGPAPATALPDRQAPC